mgnify:CR=1 FL=1|tara:strand:- start:1474 stop:1818 length:345 start_codon:yes stop_codon:yes gene_type:complete
MKTEDTGIFKMLNQGTKGVRASRAKLVAEDIIEAQEALVLYKKAQLRDEKRKIERLTDLSPDSELSLLVVKEGFSAKKLVSDIDCCDINIENYSMELELAEKRLKEFKGVSTTD